MHSSAAEFAKELVEKFWEDALCGRIFFASSDHPALEESEGWPGVFSSPAGRVGKTDPVTREETAKVGSYTTLGTSMMGASKKGIHQP